MRFSGEWKDIGTWNTLTEAMEENVVGKGILNEECEKEKLGEREQYWQEYFQARSFGYSIK